MDWTILWWVLSVVLIVVGLAGTVVPALPGVPIVFIGLLLAAWIDGFTAIGWGTLVVLGLLTLLSIVIDLLAAAFGTQRMGASPRALGRDAGRAGRYLLRPGRHRAGAVHRCGGSRAICRP
jgi:hypothetical protein